jgi:hypothetical protein
MRISKEKLLSEAESSGFRAEILEKVILLLNLLKGFRDHPFLKDRLALKGGTALNLFIFDLPRLSVDIDLNYIGAFELEAMRAERPKIEEAIRAVCAREEFTVRNFPQEHAGGKWSLRYESALGQGGNLEVDVNFMFRVPLWPIMLWGSRVIGPHKAEKIPVLDIREIAEGKVTALLARHAARDLFDAHLVLARCTLVRKDFRVAFVVYGAMSRKDWRTISVDDLTFETEELENSLLPLLRVDFLETLGQTKTWVHHLVDEVREALRIVLPFQESEREFLDRLLDHGEIEPSLLTPDRELAERIKAHPGLAWKALNVRKFKGKS